MTIASYSDLQTRMGNYLKRGDLAALIPDFIMMAEEWFDKNVFTRARRESFIITPNQPLVQLPSDWVRVLDVWYGGTPLQFRGAGNTSAYAGGQIPSSRGFYQIIGNTLSYIGVNNDPNSKLQIDYYASLEGLSDTNTSNWLLEDSATCYLFGSLMHAAAYVRDQTQLAIWQGFRDDAIQIMVDDDQAAKTPVEGILQIVAG